MGTCLDKLKGGRSGKDGAAIEKRNKYRMDNDDEEKQSGEQPSQTVLVNQNKPGAPAGGAAGKHSWDNKDRAAQKAAYRKLLF